MFPRISETEVLPPLNGATISAPVTRPTNRPRCAYSGQWSTGTCKQIERRSPNLPGVPTDGHRVRGKPGWRTFAQRLSLALTARARPGNHSGDFGFEGRNPSGVSGCN